MVARKCFEAASLAICATVLFAGCMTPIPDQDRTDWRANSLVPLNLPIENSTFDFVTPSFDDSKPDKETDSQWRNVGKAS